MKFTTPEGRMGFCAIHEANTKFDKEQYIAQVIVDPEDPKFLALKAQVEQAEEDFRRERRLPNSLPTSWPWVETLDRDTKEPTGEMTIKTKMAAAQYKIKGGPPIPQRPLLIDVSKQKMPAETKVGSGSTVRVAGDVSFYAAAQTLYVSFKMVALQVLDLVEAGSNYNPPKPVNLDDYDFGSEGEVSEAGDPFGEEA